MSNYKQIITIVMILMFSVTSHAAYYKQTVDGKVVKKMCWDKMPEGEGWALIEGDPAEVEIYQEPIVSYNSNTMITWGLNNVLAQLPASTADEKADRAAAIAAFLDFANKANQESYVNFVATATLLGLTDTANTIVTRAIELGAPITVEE